MLKFKVMAVTAGTLAALGLAAGPALATGAPQPRGGIQYASNYPGTNSYPFVVSASPLTIAGASQSRVPRGVQLDVNGANGYVSSAVIVPLGHLSSLFNASGEYVPPEIGGTGLSNVLENLYFDTNGDGTYFGFHGGSLNFTTLDGDNAASMGSVNNTADNADFVTFSGVPGGGTIVPLSGQMTMEQVLQAYQGAGLDPLVWAWIGIQSSSGQLTATITSVNGMPLGTAP